jgi:hypothetical protein
MPKSLNSSCRFWYPNRETLHHLGFEDQPRNSCYSSPHARCRPHTVPPDLSITWPLSIRPVWSSLVLCIRSPTPATIVIAARHASPDTYTLWDKQIQFSKWNKNKGKTNKTVLDLNSNLTKSMTHHNQTKELILGFSIPPFMSQLTTKRHKVWSLNPTPYEE